MSAYQSRAAQDAERTNYGSKPYWDYLERSAYEMHAYYTKRCDHQTAENMLNQTLGEALQGNDGI